MEIREYKEFNEDEIMRLYSEVGWTAYTENMTALRNGYEHSLLVLAAHENDELLGIIRVVGDGFTVIFIQDLLVSPEKQRQGIGTALLQAVLARYPDVRQIELTTDNTPQTVAFYKSLGFREFSEIGCFGFMKCKPTVARRDDWKTKAMPEQHETFVLNRSFSNEEMDALRRGNIPQAMEDKWFWFMEGSTLWAHRSWTGHCIYQIDFQEDGHHIVTVNRDPEQYKCTSIEEDIESLNKLLDWWTQSPYDHYHEWLSEIYDALRESGKV